MEIVYIFALGLVALFLFFLIIALVLFSADLFFELPFVATQPKKVSTIIKLANIKKGQTVIDLGSGDGRLLFAAAKLGAYSIGYEINPLLIIITILRTKFKGLSKNIKVEKRNLWDANLKIADIVFVYGRRHTMKKFQDFIYKNCKKGTRIIVNSDKTIPFPAKKPKKQENGIYLYIV